MAESGKIKASDIAEKDLFKNITKSADDFSSSLKGLEKSLKEIKKSFTVVLQTQEKVLKQNVKDIADIKAKTSALTKSQAARIGLIEVEKQELRLRVEQEKLNRQLATSQKQINKDIADSTKAKQREAAANKKLDSAYSQASARLNEMRKRYKDLAVQEKQNTATGKLLRDEINKLDKQLKEVDATVGQFQRNVGNYKQSIKDFVKELVTMGFWLKVAKESASLVKDELFKSQDVVDEVAIKTAQLADSTTGFTGANERAAKSVIAYRETLLLLEETLAQVNLDLQDQQEISDDITIGFETRNTALEKSIRLGKQAANIELIRARTLDNIAQAEFDAAKANARGGKELAAADEKRLASAIALKAANDKVNDLARINDKERRERALEEASFKVGLLIKKKESANAEKVILESQLQDERLQLEERINLSDELLKVEKATTDEAIKIIKEKTGLEINAADLLAEKDADKLRLKIENIEQDFINAEGKKETTKIGREAAELIAKVIKKSQDSTLEFEERKRKFAEEEIDRKNRILEIENEIDELNNNQVIKRLEDTLTEEQELAEYFNEKSLEDRAIYNETFQKLRREQSDKIIAEEMNITNEKIKQLELQAENDKAATEIEINDDLERAAKKKAIDAKLLIDIENLKIESNKKTETEAEKQAKIEAEINKKKLDAITADKKKKKELSDKEREDLINETIKLTQALEDELDKQSQKKLDAFDKEIDAREESVDRQTQLAEDGLTNQLAFEIAQKEKAELEKQEFEERVAKEKEALALVESYQAFLLTRLKEENANPNTAPFLALKDTLLAKGVAKSIVQFAAEGNNMIDGEGTTTSDSIPFMLSKKEAVIKASENIKHNEAVVSLNNGTFDKQYISITDMPTNVKVTDNTFASNQFITKLNEIKAEIKNKPVQTWEVNNMNELVEKRIVADITQKIVYKHKYKFH